VAFLALGLGVVPDLNSFFALLATVFMYLILPVPWPFLLETFNDQLSRKRLEAYFSYKKVQCLILAAGYPQAEQTCFCLWKVVLPHLRQRVWVLVCLRPNDGVPLALT